ncbi:MAG TPA: hypothetical protein VHS99_11075, partial [Chloroflexota bacterium]|nr:hypothetical protein [Chloroflexota bacterium]
MAAETLGTASAVDVLALRADGGADGDGQVLAPPGAPERRWFGRSRELLAMPHLIEVQLRSFAWFRREGLRELFAEISPIAD